MRSEGSQKGHMKFEQAYLTMILYLKSEKSLCIMILRGGEGNVDVKEYVWNMSKSKHMPQNWLESMAC